LKEEIGDQLGGEYISASYPVWEKYCPDQTLFTVTTTSTLTNAATTERDHLPRASSTGETEITTVTSASCLHQFTNKEELQKAMRDPPNNLLKCRIPPSDCADSWKSFTETFRYFSARYGDRVIERKDRNEL
jgi:hypothetical protein